MLPVWLLQTGLLPAAVFAGNLSGTARLAVPADLPADAVFEAVLIDTALADAPARELGRVRLQPAGRPPFRFRIAYRDSDLSGPGRYALRATLRQAERLLYTTDTFYPVLTGAPEQPLRLRLVPVATGDPALLGLFSTVADAPRIRLCGSNVSLPVAMEGDYRRLEEAYLEEGAPEQRGQPRLARLEATIADRPSAEPGRSDVPSLVVWRFLGLLPGHRCPSGGSQAGVGAGR